MTLTGARLFSGAEDGTVARWNLAQAAIEETALAHAESLLSLDLSPDGRLLVTASAGEVKLWDSSRLTVLLQSPLFIHGELKRRNWLTLQSPLFIHGEGI